MSDNKDFVPEIGSIVSYYTDDHARRIVEGRRGPYPAIVMDVIPADPEEGGEPMKVLLNIHVWDGDALYDADGDAFYLVGGKESPLDKWDKRKPRPFN